MFWLLPRCCFRVAVVEKGTCVAVARFRFRWTLRKVLWLPLFARSSQSLPLCLWTSRQAVGRGQRSVDTVLLLPRTLGAPL